MRDALLFRLKWPTLSAFVIFLLTLATNAKGDTIFWSRLDGPYGAIYALDVDSRQLSTLITGTGPGGAGGNGIYYPQALAADRGGNVYVGNERFGNVVKVTPTGVASSYAPDSSLGSYGLAFGPDGSLYNSHAASGTVTKVPPGGG